MREKENTPNLPLCFSAGLVKPNYGREIIKMFT